MEIPSGRSGSWAKRTPSSTSKSRRWCTTLSVAMSYKPSLAMTQASRLLILPMSVLFLAFTILYAQAIYSIQVYSNGLAEVILGKAIKKLNLPRDEIVVMTKVCVPPCVASSHLNIASAVCCRRS